MSFVANKNEDSNVCANTRVGFTTATARAEKVKPMRWNLVFLF